VKQYYSSKSEVATHTVHHIGNPPKEEIEGARALLSQNLGIPEQDIGGFRAPFLLYSPDTFQYLYELNFTYDCSISELSESILTPDRFHKIWPYTLDYGIAQKCNSGTCDYSKKYPGLFEIPMYTFDDINGQPLAIMDPIVPDILGLLKDNFLAHYNGNRSPMGIWLHPAWIAYPNHTEILNEFIEWTLHIDNVWFITGKQLIQYMLNSQDITLIKYWPPVQCNNNTD